VITGIIPVRADNVNLKAAPGTLSAMQIVSLGAAFGLRFLPLGAFVHLRTMSGGALTTSPGIRIGTNGTHNDVCPAVIPPTSIVVNQINSLPLASPLQAPPISSADIFVEITQSAIGPTTMTADFVVYGIIIG